VNTLLPIAAVALAVAAVWLAEVIKERRTP
jgi:hypothetical protein